MQRNRRVPFAIWVTLWAKTQRARQRVGLTRIVLSRRLPPLVIVRAPRARRDVDQGRVFVDVGDSRAVSIDVSGGGFGDQLAQRIAKTEARTFTNVGHGGTLLRLCGAGCLRRSIRAPHE